MYEQIKRVKLAVLPSVQCLPSPKAPLLGRAGGEPSGRVLILTESFSFSPSHTHQPSCPPPSLLLKPPGGWWKGETNSPGWGAEIHANLRPSKRGAAAQGATCASLSQHRLSRGSEKGTILNISNMRLDSNSQTSGGPFICPLLNKWIFHIQEQYIPNLHVDK